VFNNLGSAVLLLPLVLLVGGWPTGTRYWVLLVLLGVAQFGLPYYLYSLGLVRVPAYQAALVTMAEPILNPLWAYIAMGVYLTNKHVNYRWVYDATCVPWEATMFSMIAFFIASAAFRTFRIRTAEAAVMGLVAAFVMLGNVPIGPVISDYIPQLKDWLMNVPNGAGFRAIRIGIYIGTFAAAMRIALGLERAHLGSGAQ